MIVPLVKTVGIAGLSMAGVSVWGVAQAADAASWVDAIAPTMTAVVAGVAALLTYRQRRNETRIAGVETRSKGQSAWIDQIQEQQNIEALELAKLRRQFAKLYRLLLRYQFGAPRLVVQILDNGLTPVWEPPADSEIDAILNDPMGPRG